MNTSFKNIFFLYFKIGALLLGGGYVILPLLLSEVVEKRNWMQKEELINYYSLSQCIPGIIAVNTAIFSGYKVRGFLGAVAAVFGVCAVPFLVIVCLASVLGAITDYPLVKSIFWGVGIGVIVMIFLTIKEVWAKSIVDKFALLLFIAIFLASAFYNISPVILIVLASVLGVLYKVIVRKVSL